jgi:uncharacterized protein involved in exopolysaccharide biosynthesis
MSFELIIQVLKTRFWWLLLATLLTALGAAWFLDNAKAEYQATTSLVLDIPNQGPLSTAGFQRQLGTDYLMTQVDIIKSPRVAKLVIESLPPESLRALVDELLSEEAIATPLNRKAENKLTTRILQQLTVEPSRDSRVIYVTVVYPTAEMSAALADAFADAYMALSVELQVEPIRRNADWFDGQLAGLRDRLEEKQRLLTEYQQEVGILAIDERLDAATRRFEQLSARLVEAQAETYQVASRQLGFQHPEYKRAIRNETRIANSLEAEKEKLFAAKRERDQLGLLSQDVESAKLTYNAALQRYQETSLESRFNQTNISILSRASVPHRASGLSRNQGLVLAIALGVLFGIGVALLLEVINRRLHTARDVTRATGLEVLAEV